MDNPEQNSPDEELKLVSDCSMMGARRMDRRREPEIKEVPDREVSYD